MQAVPSSELPAPPPSASPSRRLSCLNRMGYDLEAKCKDIAERRKSISSRAGNGGGGGGGGSGPGKGPGTAGAAAKSPGRPNSTRPAAANAPNYTSESVIVDIYTGAGALGHYGAKERSTRASRRTASSVSPESRVSMRAPTPPGVKWMCCEGLGSGGFVLGRKSGTSGWPL